MRVVGFLLFLLLISCSKDTVKYNAKTYDWCNEIIVDFEQKNKSGLSAETYHWCTMLMSEAGKSITVKPLPSAPVTEMKVRINRVYNRNGRMIDYLFNQTHTVIKVTFNLNDLSAIH